jgi:signal recognition particle GTPase
VARKELDDVDALIAALTDAITAILLPSQKPLELNANLRPARGGRERLGQDTTIGKLARRFADARKHVVLSGGDTFRAAAIEQLGVWADRAGADIVQQQAGADPGAVVFDAVQAARSRRADVVIIDTAGRLHSQSHLMDELKKVKRVIQRVEPSAPHEVLLVLDANQGQNALTQATQFHEAVGVTGLVLTKLDGTAKGGIVIAIARKLGLPIRFIRRRRTGRRLRRIRRARLRERAGFRQQRGRRLRSRHDHFRQRREALSEWPRGARGRDVHHPAGRVRVPHRPLRRGQEQRAEADRACSSARAAARSR